MDRIHQVQFNELSAIANLYTMILSLYTILFTYKDKYYLYSTRSNFFCEISEILYSHLNSGDIDSLPEEIRTKLISKEIILKKENVYNFYYRELLRFNAYCNDNNTLHLVIAPTSKCNFACPYCFEPSSGGKTINSETIKALTKFVEGHNHAKELSITWYGGEPLLAFKQMVEIFESLKKIKSIIISDQSIVTNGYLFNDRVISFFKENGCSNIQITIDGVEETHDKTRCLKSGKSSTFKTIITNLDRIAAELKNTTVSIRVNVDKTNYESFIDVLNYINNRYPDNSNINVYPGMIRQENDECNALCASSFLPSEILDFNELIRQKGFDTSDFPIKRERGCMMHKMASYLIGPEGEIYKCWNDINRAEKVIGNVYAADLSNSPLLIYYAAQSTPFNEDCKNCHAFPVCNGGCGYHRYRNNFEGGKFNVCSPYKDKEKLINALITSKIKT